MQDGQGQEKKLLGRRTSLVNNQNTEQKTKAQSFEQSRNRLENKFLFSALWSLVRIVKLKVAIGTWVYLDDLLAFSHWYAYAKKRKE